MEKENSTGTMVTGEITIHTYWEEKREGKEFIDPEKLQNIVQEAAFLLSGVV